MHLPSLVFMDMGPSHAMYYELLGQKRCQCDIIVGVSYTCMYVGLHGILQWSCTGRTWCVKGLMCRSHMGYRYNAASSDGHTSAIFSFSVLGTLSDMPSCGCVGGSSPPEIIILAQSTTVYASIYKRGLTQCIPLSRRYGSQLVAPCHHPSLGW